MAEITFKKFNLMLNYFRKHQLILLLIALIIFTILRILVLVFLDGYYLLPIIYVSLAQLLVNSIRFALIIGCIVITTKSIFRHQFKLGFTLSWVLLALIALIPNDHFQTIGALLSIHNADPKQIRDDARLLLDQYEPMTYFSYFPKRSPFNNPISKDKLPSSLLNGNIGDVFVSDNYVFIEKHGLTGLFRGFIVFREGSDIWKNEKPITLLNGCSYCWKIRVVDGLYWYHAVPIAEEVATVAVPLK